MENKMQVSEVSSECLQKIQAGWKNRGVSESELQEFLQADENPKINCFQVTEKDIVLALFELRDAIGSFKNMSILLSPEVEICGGEYEEVERQILYVTNILANIFSYIINNPLESKGKIKIWNDRAEIHSILLSFAQYLENNYKNLYSVKVYRSWIDISKKEG